MALLLGAAEFMSISRLVSSHPGPLSFWMRTTSTVVNQEIVSRHDASASFDGFGIVLNNSPGKLIAYGKTTSAQVWSIGGTRTVNDGLWHHVFMNIWYANSKANQLFVDGVFEGQGTSTNPLWGGSVQPLRFGRSNDSFWGGGNIEFAEIATWGGGTFNAYLTPDEVLSLAKGVPPFAVQTDQFFQHIPLVRTARDRVAAITTQPTLSGGTFTDQPRLVGGRI